MNHINVDLSISDSADSYSSVCVYPISKGFIISAQKDSVGRVTSARGGGENIAHPCWSLLDSGVRLDGVTAGNVKPICRLVFITAVFNVTANKCIQDVTVQSKYTLLC